jgi:hypothetical protein
MTDVSRKSARRDFRTRVLEGDSYGTLFICIVATYVVVALVEDSSEFRPVITAAYGLTLLLALHTSHVRGRLIVGFAILVAFVFAGSVAVAMTGEPFRGGSYLMVILVAIAPVVVLVRIARHPVVNLETVIGAIDAYLLIGIAYSAVYRMMDAMAPHFFAQGKASAVQYLYFSFTVLTTLGFGDLSPGTDPGRVVVTSEALLGQLFLVTIVAVLVANLGRARRPVRAVAAESDPDEDDD